MNIGELAELSGLNSKMIRRYEELGILPRPKRKDSGYRQYSETDVHNAKFVKRARELGFSMKDIKVLLGLWRNKNRASAQVKKIAKNHIDELEAKLHDIQQMLNTLKHLSKNCHGDSRPECPILDELVCAKNT